jgi:putative hemolysin
MVHLESTLSDALIKAHLDMHTRFPVCARDEDPQTIQGYVNFKDIIMAMKIKPADPTVKSIMRPIRTIHGSTPISNTLEQMIHDKIHIALVASSDGHVMGLITLEDIIEELVGDIEDEFDRLPTHIHAYGPTWIMGGGVLMNLVMTTVGLEWSSGAPEARSPTLAEWVTRKLGRAPQGGETFRLDGLQITVRKLRRKKLAEAIVTAAGR